MRLRDSIHDAISATLFELAVRLMRPQMIAAVKAQLAVSPTNEPRSVAGWVACPDCGMELPIGLTPLKLGTGENGEQVVSADLEMDDVWAHAWTHNAETGKL